RLLRASASGSGPGHRPALRRFAAAVLAASAWCASLAAADLRAQPSGDLPEQLRVIAEVRFRGTKHLGRRELKAAHLKTRNPSRSRGAGRPTRRQDSRRAAPAAIPALYRHYGYLDARAHWLLESTPDPEAAAVVFVVEEGRRSKVAEV